MEDQARHFFYLSCHVKTKGGKGTGGPENDKLDPSAVAPVTLFILGFTTKPINPRLCKRTVIWDIPVNGPTHLFKKSWKFHFWDHFLSFVVSLHWWDHSTFNRGVFPPNFTIWALLCYRPASPRSLHESKDKHCDYWEATKEEQGSRFATRVMHRVLRYKLVTFFC